MCWSPLLLPVAQHVTRPNTRLLGEGERREERGSEAANSSYQEVFRCKVFVAHHLISLPLRTAIFTFWRRWYSTLGLFSFPLSLFHLFYYLLCFPIFRSILRIFSPFFTLPLFILFLHLFFFRVFLVSSRCCVFPLFVMFPLSSRYFTSCGRICVMGEAGLTVRLLARSGQQQQRVAGTDDVVAWRSLFRHTWRPRLAVKH